MKNTLFLALLLTMFTFNCGDGCGGAKHDSMHENPCAMHDAANPCAANPCGEAANPCAEAANPCAEK